MALFMKLRAVLEQVAFSAYLESHRIENAYSGYRISNHIALIMSCVVVNLAVKVCGHLHWEKMADLATGIYWIFLKNMASMFRTDTLKNTEEIYRWWISRLFLLIHLFFVTMRRPAAITSAVYMKKWSI